MQMQARLPKADRKSLHQVVLTGGIRNLYTNCSWTVARKSLVAVGGMGGYDQIKLCAMDCGVEDSVLTHAGCGLAAGVTATVCEQIVQGISGWRGVGSGSLSARKIFVIGFVPSFCRLGPQTSFTFVFLEQLRLNFGLEIIQK